MAGFEGRVADPSSCGFEGDNDLYGAGIRLGSYLQWFTTAFAYHFAPEKALESANGNCIFQLAMLIATVNKIARMHNTNPVYVVEAFIMTLFGVGGGLASLTAAFVTRSPSAGGSRLAEIARLFLLLIYSAYSTWFWFHGINVLPSQLCPSYVFFFSETRLHGWFETFSRVMICLATFSQATNFIYLMWSVFVNWDEKRAWLAGPTHFDMPLSKIQSLNWRTVLFMHCLALGTFITMIELCLKWNKVQGVGRFDSAGQLIALIIGFGCLWNAVISSLTNKKVTSSPNTSHL